MISMKTRALERLKILLAEAEQTRSPALPRKTKRTFSGDAGARPEAENALPELGIVSLTRRISSNAKRTSDAISKLHGLTDYPHQRH